MSTKHPIVAILLLGLGLWLVVNLLLSGGLFTDRIQNLVITPLRTHLGPDVTVKTVQLTLLPTRLTLREVVIPPFGNSIDVLNEAVHIEQINMKFNPWSLLTETLILPAITIMGVDVSLRNIPNRTGPSAPLGIPFLLSQYWPREVVLRDVAFKDLNLTLGANSDSNSVDHWVMTEMAGRLRSDFAMETFHLDLTEGSAALQAIGVARGKVNFSPTKGKMVFEPHQIEIKNFSVGGTLGDIVFHGNIRNPNAPILEIYADGKSSFENLYTLNIFDDFSSFGERPNGILHVKGELVGAWPKVSTRGVFGVTNLRLSSTTLSDVQGSFRLEDGQLKVDKLETNIFNGNVHGSIQTKWETQQPIDTHFSLQYTGTEGEIELSGSLEDSKLDLVVSGFTHDIGSFSEHVDTTEPFSGKLDLQGSITGTILRPKLNAHVNVVNLMFRDRYIDSGWMTLTYADGEIDIPKAIFRKGAGFFDIQGKMLFEGGRRFPSIDLVLTSQNASPGDVIALLDREFPIPERANGTMLVHIDNLDSYLIKGALSFSEGRLFGEEFDEGIVEFLLKPEGATFTNLELRQGPGVFEGRGQIGFDGNFRGSLRGSGLNAQKISWVKKYLPGLNGKISIHLVGSGTLDRPLIHGEVKFHKFRYGDVFFGKGHADIQTRNSSSTLVSSFDRGVQVNAAINWKEQVPFTVSANFSDFDGSALIYGLIPTVEKASLELTGDLQASGSIVEWNKSSLVAQFPIVRASVNEYEIQSDGRVEAIFQDSVLTINKLRFLGEDTSANIAGYVIPLEKYGLNFTGDLNPRIAQFLSNGISVERGIGKIDIAIEGKWDEPRIVGTYGIDHLLLRSRFSEQPILISDMSMQFNGENISIDSFNGGYGGGVIHGDGLALVTDWKLKDFSVNAKLADVEYSTEPGLIGSLDGDLRFEGGNHLQKVAGNITVERVKSNARRTVTDFLVNNFQPLLSSPVGPHFQHPVEVDIHAVGKNGLYFQNPLLRLPLDIDILVKGTLQEPEFLGRIGSRGGDIFIGKRQFDILDASIDFVSQQDHRALYTLHAKSFVRSHDVDLFVSGIDDKVNISFASNPPLSEDVILAYLKDDNTRRMQSFPEFRHDDSAKFLTSPLASDGAARTLLSHRVEAEKQVLANRLYALLSTPAVPADEQLIRLKYPVSDKFSFVGERNEEGRVVGDIRFTIDFP